VRKKFFNLLRLIWALLSISGLNHFFSIAQADEGKAQFAVTQIVEHPALDSTRKGIEDEIKAQKPDVFIEYENAQGSMPTAIQIGQKFLNMKPSVIVAISTPSAQAVLRGAAGVPIVFAAVSNPDAAGLTHDDVRDFVTGTTDLPPIGEQLIFAQALFPQVKKIGVIFNAGEANSVSFIEQLKQECEKANIELVESAVVKSSDVTSAVARVISNGVDFILLPQDNTVVLALDAVLKATNAAGVPIIASDTDLISKGVFAAVGYSRYEAGRETGKIVMDVFRGASPKDIPIRPAGNLKRIINERVRDVLEIQIPESTLKQCELYRE
jgi:putative ABC transport system substrate-binding protein